MDWTPVTLPRVSQETWSTLVTLGYVEERRNGEDKRRRFLRLTEKPLGSDPQTNSQWPSELIKPSHYDDDGYVIRWWRAMIPSNSLAAVYGIAADCAERQVLGPDVAIDIAVSDETNTHIDVSPRCWVVPGSS
jgi:hypothetical protein